MTPNPVTYFEIPVTYMGRVIEFYEAVFAVAQGHAFHGG